MDNKMVLAIVLSAIVLFSYQIFFYRDGRTSPSR